MFFCIAGVVNVAASRFLLSKRSLSSFSTYLLITCDFPRLSSKPLATYNVLPGVPYCCRETTHDNKHTKNIKPILRPNANNILWSLHIQTHPVKTDISKKLTALCALNCTQNLNREVSRWWRRFDFVLTYYEGLLPDLNKEINKIKNTQSAFIKTSKNT